MTAIFTYLGIEQQALYALMGLMCIDFALGVSAAIVIDRKSLKSSVMAGGILMKASKLLLPFAFGLGGLSSNLDLNTFVTFVMSILILAEIYSVVSHVYNINTGKKAPEIDAVEIIFKRLSAIIHSMAQKPDKEDKSL